MGEVTAPQSLPVQPPAGPDNTAPAAPAPIIKAGISEKPAAASPAAAPAPPAAPLPLPAGKEPPFPASDFHADGSLGSAAGTHPVNTDEAFTDANHKPGVVFSEALNISVKHATAAGNTGAVVVGVDAREASLPLDSAIRYKGSLAVGHVFDPLLKVGVEGKLYGSNPLHVRDGDPKDEPAGYRYGQIAVTADSKDKTADGAIIDAHVDAGYRFGPGYTNRVNVAAQGTVTEQAGPVEIAVTGGVTGGVWTDRTPEGQPRRMDVLGNVGIKASTAVDDSGNIRVFATAGFDGRVSSQDDGRGSKNYGNFGAGLGIQVSVDGSSKSKPKR
jgi:hypothetical protein